MQKKEATVGKSLRHGQAGKTGLGLAGLNHFGGLWGIGTVPSCLVPSPGVIKVGG